MSGKSLCAPEAQCTKKEPGDRRCYWKKAKPRSLRARTGYYYRNNRTLKGRDTTRVLLLRAHSDCSLGEWPSERQK
jgi:hypothetical protein